MTEAETRTINAIVNDYRTRANDANVYIDIMEGRLWWLNTGIGAIKLLTLLAPVLLTFAVDPQLLSNTHSAEWQTALKGLTDILGGLVVLGYARNWDDKKAALEVFVELLRVQQLGFQRQAAMEHDNVNNIGYTHRLETERHDLLLGRIAKYVTLQDFKKRAKKLGLSPQPTA